MSSSRVGWVPELGAVGVVAALERAAVVGVAGQTGPRALAVRPNQSL